MKNQEKSRFDWLAERAIREIKNLTEISVLRGVYMHPDLKVKLSDYKELYLEADKYCKAEPGEVKRLIVEPYTRYLSKLTITDINGKMEVKVINSIEGNKLDLLALAYKSSRTNQTEVFLVENK